MNLGRCGPGNLTALPCLVLVAILSVFVVEAGQWDTKGAQSAFKEAEKQYGALKQRPDAPLAEYLQCARTCRTVYTKDPHYPQAAEAVYYEGLLYQEMGDRFNTQEYFLLAVRRFDFLVSDYGGNQNCPDALLRTGEIYTKKLNDPAKAKAAYRILKTQYGHTGIRPPETTATKSAPKASGQASSENRNMHASTGKISTIRNIRHWSSKDYTRLVIDLDSDAQYVKALIDNPRRMYFDITNATLEKGLHNRTYSIKDTFLKQVRVAQYNPTTVRIVLDFSNFSAYSDFKLQNPDRIVIDLHKHPGEREKTAKPEPLKPLSKETAEPPEAESPTKTDTKPRQIAQEKDVLKTVSKEKNKSPLSGKKEREKSPSRGSYPERPPGHPQSGGTDKLRQTYANENAWIENRENCSGSWTWRPRSRNRRSGRTA